MKKIKKIMAYALIFTMVIASVGISKTEVAEATCTNLDIAIFGDSGADTSTISALCVAFERMGHNPMIIAAGDLKHNRLTTSNFDILVVPASDPDCGLESGYDDTLGAYESKIQSFANAGGGVIGIEYGAAYLCDNMVIGGDTKSLDTNLYSGNAYVGLSDFGHGMGVMVAYQGFSDESVNMVYMSSNTPFFTIESGVDVLGRYNTGSDSTSKAAVIGFQYNNGGHVVLIGPRPEVDVKSEDDLSYWDNEYNQYYDSESDIDMLARAVEYAKYGQIIDDTNIAPVTTSGMRVGVYVGHSHEYGGAWPAYLPAIFKSILAAGHTPVAIGTGDIANGLSTDEYDVVLFPGGYSAGYWNMLYGLETNISTYVYNGGGVMGICAGAYYLSNLVTWEHVNYNYPVNIFMGSALGPINDIAQWPSRALTTVDVDDSTLGINDDFTITYYGGPYLSGGISSDVVVGEYDYSGAQDGEAAIKRGERFNGRWLLSGPHPETEEGSTNDWCWWDNYEYDSTTAQTDPDSEWGIIEEGLEWLADYTYTGSAPTQDSYVSYGVTKGPNDTVEDSLGDAQRFNDYYDIDSNAINDGLYSVSAGSIMEFTSFGRSASDLPFTLNSATLKVKYTLTDNHNPTNYIKWSLDGVNYNNTTIRPTMGQNEYTATFDLKAAGVDRRYELINLSIYYMDNASYPGKVKFDAVQIIVD